MIQRIKQLTPRFFLVSACACIALVLCLAPAFAATNGYKNLKVFPKDVEKAKLKSEMKAFSKPSFLLSASMPKTLRILTNFF